MLKTQIRIVTQGTQRRYDPTTTPSCRVEIRRLCNRLSHLKVELPLLES